MVDVCKMYCVEIFWNGFFVFFCLKFLLNMIFFKVKIGSGICDYFILLCCDSC